jgi:hypothetical protein
MILARSSERPLLSTSPADQAKVFAGSYSSVHFLSSICYDSIRRSKLLISSYFWEKTFFLANFLKVTLWFFAVLKSVQQWPRHWPKPVWPWALPGFKNSFFLRVTNLGDCRLISSPSTVFQVIMRTVNRGCYWHCCFCDGKILWTHTKPVPPSMGLFDD